jgi:hypothetical protein
MASESAKEVPSVCSSDSSSSKKRQRNNLSIEEKIEIIRDVDSKKSYKKISEERGVPKSTIATIISNRAKIEKSYTMDGMRKVKKIRHGEFEDVEENLLTWFKQQRSRNIPICGPLMKAEALRIAKKLGRDNFEASTGWLDRFKVRHGIVFNTAAGESAGVDMTVVNDHLSIIANAVKTYSLRDVYNMDELALFYK